MIDGGRPQAARGVRRHADQPHPVDRGCAVRSAYRSLRGPGREVVPAIRSGDRDDAKKWQDLLPT